MREWIRKHLTIGRRLALSFVMVVVLMFVGSAVALWQFNVVRTQAQHLHQVDLQEIGMLRVHKDVLQFRDMLQLSLEASETDRLASEVGLLQQSLTVDVDRAIEALRVPASDTHRHELLLTTLETTRSSVIAQAESILKLARLGDWQAAEFRLENQVKEIIHATEQVVKEIESEIAVDRASTLQKIERIQQRALITLLTTAVLTLVLAASLGIVVTKGITRPLMRLGAGTRALARGDFQHQVAVTGGDELASLARVFNDMASRLRELYEALQRSEAHFRSLIENASDLIMVSNQEGIILYVSPSSERVVGYHADALVGRNVLDFIHPDDSDAAKKAFSASAQTHAATMIESRFRHRDASWRTMEATASSLLQEPAVAGIVMNWRDITEHKRAEEQIKISLREKEVLLKEIHHRVKNNLQVISSLINLQSAHIKHQQARELLRECQNRVRSMALVHDRLYRSANLARIDASEYFRNLAENLFTSYGVQPNSVQLQVEADDVELSIDTAIACGILVNELVSNSLKHAFKNGQQGEVRIELRSEQGGQLLLRVSDNGIGLPRTVDYLSTESLGLQLVNTLAAQLDGSIELANGTGTTFEMRFYEMRYKDRV